MKDNITKLKDCYGCGVCVRACPVHIIALKENRDGFYQPVIDEQEKCIECGMCLKTCAFNHNEVAQTDSQTDCYGAWSNNENVRLRCSSGGVGFEIGRKLIENGYAGVGVRYNPATNRAEHFVAHTVEEFMPSAGSKYIPSDMTKALAAIDPKKNYFVTGLPCQIDSFRRYIGMLKKEDNFVLLDFFCHGVPSLLLWDKYTARLREKIGDITFASWRNKTTGWHDSWSMQADKDAQSLDWQDSYNLNVCEKKHFYASRKSQGDLFYKLFLDNYCLNKCCYATCKYKMHKSAADIRIGDAWGSAYKDDDQGVSVVMALTQKGRDVLASLGQNVTLEPQPYDVATEVQMKKNARQPPVREKIIRALRGKMTLLQINDKIIKPYRRRLLPARIANRILRLFGLSPKFSTR